MLPGFGLTSTFDFSGSGVEEIESEIDQVFASDQNHILKPDDVKESNSSLRNAITSSGWPTLSSSRGKIIFVLMARDEAGNILDQSAGFLDQNGDLLNLSGGVGIPLENTVGNYISIHTRSHLAVVSSGTYTGDVYDFTSASTQAKGINQLKGIAGKYMLHAGDFDSSGVINSVDFNNWKIKGAALNQYLLIDGDGNGIINAADYNLWINNRSKVGEEIIRY